jgi:hypothetical protein
MEPARDDSDSSIPFRIPTTVGFPVVPEEAWNLTISFSDAKAKRIVFPESSLTVKVSS